MRREGGDLLIQIKGIIRIGVLLLLTSCTAKGESGEYVPLDVPRAIPVTNCIDINAETRVVSVAPEGQLWVETPDGSGSLDTTGLFIRAEFRVSQISDGQAWDGHTLSFVSNGELWNYAQGQAEFQMVPDDVGRVEQFCGDPSQERASFVISDSGLFERSDGLWWHWKPNDGGQFGTGMRFVRVDGACTSQRGDLWLLNDEQQLWQISKENAEISISSDLPIDQAVASSGGVAILSTGQMSLGPSPWVDVEFEEGAVTAIGGAGDKLWAIAGETLYVRSRSEWRSVEVEMTPESTIYAYAAGGAWVVSNTMACHIEVKKPLVLSGLRPFSHLLPTALNIRVSSLGEEIVLLRDDEEIARESPIDDHATFAGIDLGDGGWHTLQFVGVETEIDRTIAYFIVNVPDVSWNDQIVPLFQRSCAGALCHGPDPDGSRVDLSRYEAWRGRSALIQQRILRNEMPPIDPKLSSESVQLVLDWIAGGMKP